MSLLGLKGDSQSLDTPIEFCKIKRNCCGAEDQERIKNYWKNLADKQNILKDTQLALFNYFHIYLEASYPLIENFWYIESLKR